MEIREEFMRTASRSGDPPAIALSGVLAVGSPTIAYGQPHPCQAPPWAVNPTSMFPRVARE